MRKYAGDKLCNSISGIIYQQPYRLYLPRSLSNRLRTIVQYFDKNYHLELKAFKSILRQSGVTDDRYMNPMIAGVIVNDMEREIEEFKRELMKRKSKIVKCKDAGTLSQPIDSKDYYKIKHFTADDIPDPDQKVIQRGHYQYIMRVVKAIRALAQYHISMPEESRQVYVTRTGYEIPAGTEFEWCVRSQLNIIYAVFCRQLSCKTIPNKTDLAKFSKLTTSFWTDFKNKWSQIPVEPRSFKEDLLAKTTFTDEKKLKYWNTIMRQKYGLTNKFVGNFSMMVKSGEVHFTKMAEELDGRLKHESRPRCICLPDKTT